MKKFLDRLARRAATAIGGGAIVSGDDMATAVGVFAIIAEFVFAEWRERRAAKKAANGG